jgi:DNA-binding transcriptional MerR regulator/methylmalonyl-CoA mutase cobalamin-binding subunit
MATIGKYTVQEVEARTGVPAATLRQWERRYGCPLPQRSPSGYRYYGDEDLDRISKMKRYIDQGMAASRAAALVQLDAVQSDRPRPLADLRSELLAALLQLDGADADRVIGEAHALYAIEAVLLELYPPIMAELGERWHDGRITTATEHYASSYIQGRLHQLLSLAGHNAVGPRVIVACAPGDQHELGALTLAVMLRREGYAVTYLGPNNPVRDLAAMAKQLQAWAVMISAASPDSVAQLLDQRQHLRGVASVLAFGGHGFDVEPSRASDIGGYYLGRSLRDALQNLQALRSGVVNPVAP